MKTPKAPDPYKTAAAQQKAEVGAAGASSVMNNPNIVNPYGSQSYSISGWEQVPDATGKMISVPRYTQTQSLSPDQMKLLGLETQSQYNMGQTAVEQSAKMRQHLGTQTDTSGWQPWQGGPQAAKLATGFGSAGDIQRGLTDQSVRQDQSPTDRAGVQNAMMQLYNRQAGGKNAAEQAQLAARGMNAGSSQYGSTAKRQGDEFTDAALKAYLGSGEEARASQDAYNQAAAQRFGQGAQMGQFANQAQQQNYDQLMGRSAFSNDALANMYNMGGQTADRANALRGMQSQEALALRNQPINEISALMSGGQVNVPQFAGYQGQGINPANIMGAVNNNYNQQVASAGAFNSGLFNMLGAGLGAVKFPSDRRLKKDIQPTRARIAGVPLYRFRYRWDPGTVQIGVMADEAILMHPDVVSVVDGYYVVDYDRLRHHDKKEANP